MRSPLGICMHSFLSVLLSTITASVAWSGTVTPTTVADNPGGSDFGAAVNIINGNGLSSSVGAFTDVSTITHFGGGFVAGNVWLESNFGTTLTFALDGGSPVDDLNALHLWQYSQNTASCCQGRGVKDVRVSFSTDGGTSFPDFVDLTGFNAAISTAGSPNEPVQTMGFAERDGVTHVQFSNMTDHAPLANAGFIGLAEIRFGTSALPPPVSPGVFIDEDIEDNVNGWSGWGGSVAAGSFLPLASDIDDPALTNATSVPDAINVLNGQVPFMNNTQSPTKEYDLAIEAGTYEFLAQVVNFNNAGFPDPFLDFNGLTPDLVEEVTPGSGDDEIWRYVFTVAEDSPIIGDLATLTFEGTGTGNAGLEHVLATFTPAAVVPEATSVAIWIGLGILVLPFVRCRHRRS